MSQPLVSVIVPTYLGAAYLPEAIESVLAQRYPHWELIVVNDASPDDTDAVMARYDDPRIRYIVHPQNRGALVARHTALFASQGELIAFLDHDDYFHPDKLNAHVAHFAANPEAGAVHNARFELDHSRSTIREVWQVPHPVTLADFVMGFPIAPTDLVLRREWAYRESELEDPNVFHGGEIIAYGRLYMAGCHFSPIRRPLNYHRYHAGRVVRDVEGNCRNYLFAQDTIFADPLCPPEVKALRGQAHAMSYLVWASYASNQERTELAQAYVRQAVQLNPALLDGNPSPLLSFLLADATYDDGGNHATLLARHLAQLPPEMAEVGRGYAWAVGRGFLLRGARAVLWRWPDEGSSHWEHAVQLGARCDNALIEYLVHQLLAYQSAYGHTAASEAVERLGRALRRLGETQSVNRLQGLFAANRAILAYQAGQYQRVPGQLCHALRHDPAHRTNRGLWSILARSTVQAIRHPSGWQTEGEEKYP